MSRLRQIAPTAAILALLVGIGLTAVIMTRQVTATAVHLQTEHAEQRTAAMASLLSNVAAGAADTSREVEAKLPGWSTRPNDATNARALAAYHALTATSGSTQLYTAGGRLLASAGDPGVMYSSDDPQLRSLLELARQHGRMTTLVGGRARGKLLIAEAFPTARDNRLLLVRRVTAESTSISPVIVGYAAGTHGVYTLTDAFGTVMASSRPGLEGARFPSAVDPARMASRHDLLPFQLDRRPTVGVVRQAGSLGWYVIYTQDRKSFYGGIDSASNRLVLVLVAIMIVAAAAIGILSYRRQRSISAGAERLTELIANVNDVVLVVRDDRVTYASPAVEALLGRTPVEATGCTLSDVLGATGAGILLQLIGAANGHRRPITVGDVPCRAVNGEVIWTEVTVAARHASRSIRGSVISLHDISERRQKAEVALRKASHDDLTGLLNRAAFSAETERALARSQRTSHDLAVLFLDLDGFKAINDGCGHAAGDLVLARTAERLSAELRSGDVAARLGGDEFAVLLDPLNEPAQAEEIARRLVAAVNQPVPFEGQRLHVGVSVGIAVASPQGVDTYDSLLRDADLAMYAAKESGKNTYRLASPQPQPAAPPAAGPLPAQRCGEDLPAKS